MGIDDAVYQEFFQRKSIQLIAKENRLLLMTVEMKKEEIIQWIN
ncbi:MAG: hypothetical protein EAZ09_10670 [Oscillatoriales cyanobacterium]|nr:MAG: hypothetical protein EAZ18_04645 [Oscillatoriales cyanobacterium]TAH22404.1 MAG: hypothetical protein EAZ09_10670 [Oscillatoriales cyanobacterium]